MPPNPRIRYEVHIEGHEAPFKWTVHRIGPGMLTASVTDCKGEADSYVDAMFDARECAGRAEYRRKHAATKSVEHLFEVGPDDQDEE